MHTPHLVSRNPLLLALRLPVADVGDGWILTAGAARTRVPLREICSPGSASAVGIPIAFDTSFTASQPLSFWENNRGCGSGTWPRTSSPPPRPHHPGRSAVSRLFIAFQEGN